MKKLMMAAAIVCAAVAVQAASVSWSDANKIYDGTLGTGKPEGSAYLIQYSAHSAADLVAAFEAGTLSETTVAGYAVDTSVIDSGNVGNNDIPTTVLTAGAAEQAYFVIFYGDNMFASATIDAQYDQTTGAYSFFFETEKAESKALPVSTEYAGAGWYTAAAPEPTSGLLLLLGVAGLALKRRRA